jgi:UPF0755 protein
MYDRVLPSAFLGGILAFLIYFLTFAAPLEFPTASYVRIDEGKTVWEVAEILQKEGIIRWPIMFVAASRIYGNDRSAVAGEYFFEGPQTVLRVAQRVATGDYELTPVRVTFPEGVTVKQMAETLEKKIPYFDTETFVRLAQEKEGYLFPDTYFIYPAEDPDVVIDMLTDNFEAKIKELQPLIASSSITLSDAVIMASILEKEAWKMEDRRRIAGVLWRRIAVGMPLQTDATFPYYLGRNTFQVTREDLTTDNPYNTYTNKGLPPGAIGNPGIDSIRAALEPIKSNYVFFLSDRNGNFYFSTTYAQHLRYRAQYLD